MSQELKTEQLRCECSPQIIGVESSADTQALDTLVGQDRAVRALQFGLGIQQKGFNIYVAGMPGSGRTTSTKRFLEEVASRQPAPPDWCYVNNFQDSNTPRALRFPTGRASEFEHDMSSLVNEAVQQVRSAFESEEYANHKEENLKTIQTRKQEILDGINEEANRQGFLLQGTPMGVMIVPVRNGKAMREEEFLELKPEERDRILGQQQKLQGALEAALRQSRQLDKEAGEALGKLDQEVARYAINQPVKELQEKYQGLPDVLDYINHVLTDLLDNVDQFKGDSEEQESPIPGLRLPKGPNLKKYAVNVLVDNSELKGAPVIVEMNPTYINLFGRIEQEAQFGALVTDFTLIRRGALHKANGGFLVLPVEDVLRNPFAWESLQRALENRQLIIEDATEKFGFSTRSLRPDPIPLNMKVILIGRPDIFQALLHYDEHFAELFKVKADFDTVMERNEEHIADYVSFANTVSTTEQLKHLDRSGLAKLVEHGSRLAEDQEKLTSRLGDLADVIREANYYAAEAQATLITAEHIHRAIEEHYYRSNRIQERLQEMIDRGAIKVDVSGTQIGQINGLSVLDLGDFSFGQPNRITVSISLGREGVVDIEREAKLGGPIHTKGVLILSGYLASKYAQDKPLSLAAHLVFEQSYGGVEGDSASSTELYAILSALADLPIRQGIAVTGSVNQRGEVQAIGGVNEKVEGFFEICRARGLTGDQGVMIPDSNVVNLMLKEDIIDAVQQGKFHIYAVHTIDEGIEILTGVKSGQMLDDGSFEPESVNARVNQRLDEMAQRLTEFGHKDETSKGEPGS